MGDFNLTSATLITIILFINFFLTIKQKHLDGFYLNAYILVMAIALTNFDIITIAQLLGASLVFLIASYEPIRTKLPLQGKPLFITQNGIYIALLLSSCIG